MSQKKQLQRLRLAEDERKLQTKRFVKLRVWRSQDRNHRLMKSGKAEVVSTEKSGLFCFITYEEPPARVALFYSAKLDTDRRDVLHSLGVAHSSSDVSVEKHVSYGTHCFDHLAADAACLAGSQVAVIAIGQVDADFGCSLHLELVHCLTGLGNVQLIVVLAAYRNSLLFIFPESEIDFPDWRVIFFP